MSPTVGALRRAAHAVVVIAGVAVGVAAYVGFSRGLLFGGLLLCCMRCFLLA